MNITDTKLSDRNVPNIDSSKSSHSKRHSLGDIEPHLLRESLFNGSIKIISEQGSGKEAKE